MDSAPRDYTAPEPVSNIKPRRTAPLPHDRDPHGFAERPIQSNRRKNQPGLRKSALWKVRGKALWKALGSALWKVRRRALWLPGPEAQIESGLARLEEEDPAREGAFDNADREVYKMAAATYSSKYSSIKVQRKTGGVVVYCYAIGIGDELSQLYERL
ncbi:hypothetical protein Bbelb_276430 [Branchiostoma belcheri]|nr:hypothetical protein Bbelb_276430 [Branchiostoma belcheri]